MSPSHALLPHGSMLETSRVPVLELGAWRNGITQSVHNEEARLIALFAQPRKEGGLRLHAIMGLDARGELRISTTDLNAADPSYPSLTPDLPQAHLFERELYETHGIRPLGHPWLKPVRSHQGYTFYRCEGDMIHEVAVGPVHAGIIEPGHFRFQCHGEKVLHLEIQLGYQHRGVEAAMPCAKPSLQAVLSESIAGDTAIGHGLAYSHAVEGLARVSVSARAKGLRGIALELERLANHIGDLGGLATDIGFLTAAAYFGRLRGEFLNLLMEMTGNRYGRSLVRPGGVLLDLTPAMIVDFQARLRKAGKDLQGIADLFFGSSSVLARLENTGIVETRVAKELGLVGPTARASNLLRDVRQDYPTGIYRFHQIPAVRLASGDVYARARLRSLESKRSFEFLQEALSTLAPGKIFQPCPTPKPLGISASLIEGWRGEIVHIAFTDGQGRIAFYKIIDPSFHNWTALAVAMRDQEISDFPLCNKSFNLSYAGHDL